MSSEWREVEIGSICEGIYDGPHATPKKTDDGPVFLGISSLNYGQLDLSSTEHLSEEDFVKWTKRVTPKEGDIVFSYETRLGQVAIIPDNLRCCLGRRMALMRVDRTQVIPEFLLYAYLDKSFQKVIQQRTIHGSTVDRIPLTEFGSFPITIPPLATQRDIAGTLKALDDRITLLRETNSLLEQIAQTIFKSWFVEFDPVRAKQEGRLPEGMDEETAALFPDSFEESELGMVPRGWRVGTLGDLAQLNPQAWTARNHPPKVAYIDLANVKENVIASITNHAFDEAPSRARRVLQSGDTIVGTVRPGNKSFAYIWNPPENLTGSTGFAALRPNVIENTEYIYLAATQESSIDQLAHLADGAAYPAVRPDVVASMRCPIPTPEVMRAFHEVAAPLLIRNAENQIQAQILADLRDTLLPRLISGKLRLPEAEATLENALS